MTEDQRPEPSSRQFRGHTITLNPTSWTFTVTGPEFDDDAKLGRTITFSSFSDAQTEISRRVSDTEKLQARGLKFEWPVLDQNGNLHTITRIDRRTGDIPNIDGRYIYPYVKWVEQALKRQRDLLTEAGDIRKSLTDLEISVRRSFGRIDAETYFRKVEALKREIAEKIAAAQELAKPKEVNPNGPSDQPKTA